MTLNRLIRFFSIAIASVVIAGSAQALTFYLDQNSGIDVPSTFVSYPYLALDQYDYPCVGYTITGSSPSYYLTMWIDTDIGLGTEYLGALSADGLYEDEPIYAVIE